jgi:hypothetical protein
MQLAEPTQVANLPAGALISPTISATRIAGFDEIIVYSAVTLKNNSKATIAYKISWPGVAEKSYTLKPGQSRVHWLDRSNTTARITYDKSFATGYQAQKYSLPSRDFVGGGFAGLLPKTKDGALYVFKYNSAHTGVQLYRS